METYYLSGTYATRNGYLRSFGFYVDAETDSEAMRKAADRIAKDKRRKYMGKLDIYCSKAKYEKM